MSDELATIERTMREDGGRAYWASEAMQARYRELLAGETPEPAPVEPDDGLPGMMTPSEARAAGIEDYRDYQTVMMAVGDVVAGLDTPTRIATRRSFEALPEPVQQAALDALRPRGNGARATDEGVERFARTGVGAVLVAEWGSDSQWRLGQARERLEGIYGQLSETDGARFQDWFDSLDDAAAAAVVRRLAGR